MPANLDLARFVGATLIQVCLGEFDVQFHFRPVGEWHPGDAGLEIAVYGGWQLIDSEGAIVDQAQPDADRDSYRLHRLLGLDVTSTSLEAPHSFALTFSNGLQLSVLDDDAAHETFSVQPGDVCV